MSVEEDPFILGQYAGDEFVEEINILFREFQRNYKKRNEKFDFDSDVFVEGFLEAFVSGFDK